MTETIYDVAVIGGGPGGYTAAIRGAQLGLKVALIEKRDKLGGTCLHVGCIPTKALLFNAEIWEHTKHLAEFGIGGAIPSSLDWEAVLKRKDAIVSKHAKGLDYLMKKNRITVISGHGRLMGLALDGVHLLEVLGADGQTNRVAAKNVILATGSDARTILNLSPDEWILTNIETLSIPQLPKSLIVIGAGAVGAEFSSIFRSFDAEVTLVEALPRIVPGEDEEISKELARQFRKRGIDIHTGANVQKIEKTERGVKVGWVCSDGQLREKEAERVLVAVGRLPRTSDLGLESTRIVTERGFIKVNDAQETAEPGVYAVGDIVAGLPQLSHVAMMSGMVAVTKIAGRSFRRVRGDRIPACTYTEPQVGSVGLTAAEASSRGYDVRVGKFPFAGNSKASIIGRHEGFVKVVADASSGAILGVHILGPQATELIAEAVTALELGGKVDEFMFTIHAHPTLAEAMLDAYAAVKAMAINV
jgi:dihydrolipoamide dehydrogenase